MVSRQAIWNKSRYFGWNIKYQADMFPHFGGGRMFPVPQIINILRNLGKCSCSLNTCEEHGELFLFPKYFWGTWETWETVPVLQILLRNLGNCSYTPNTFEELWGTFSPSYRDSKCPLWKINIIYLAVLSKSLSNIKEQ